MGGENTKALGFATTYTAAQLVQLGKAEAIGVLNHHQRGVGHIHTHFDHRGSHQHIRLTLGESSHHRLLFRTLHLAVDQGNAQIRKYGFLQGFCPNFRGFNIQFSVFFHRRAHHKALVTFLYMHADEGVDPGSVGLIHQEGIHRLSAGRQFVENGYFQIAVHQKGQGSGDGCRRHNQQVRIHTLGGKSCPLGNAKAVLLVGDHQA